MIDDPISSLSHNLIYEIGCLIKKEVLKNDFAQVIIFTHSLFFFHELLKVIKRTINIFELQKILLLKLQK